MQAHAPALASGVADTAGGYYFNGRQTIAEKVRLARRLGLGGVMIWEVGQDCRMRAVIHGDTTHGVTCPEGEASSLLVALRDAASEVGSGAAKEEL